MKSSLLELYKKKYAIGGKTPVRKTGMWYQDGDVVVPSNQITMKGPEGEKDYFNSPIMGIGLQSGKQQVMLPGEEYSFPNDEAVFETKMQDGGKIDLTNDIAALNPNNKKPSNFQALELALAPVTFLPPPTGTIAGLASAGINLAQGDFAGLGLDVAGVASGGVSKVFKAAMQEAKLAGAGRVARNMADKAKFFNAASNPNIYKSLGFARDYYSNEQDNSNARTNYKDNTRVASPIKPVKSKMQMGAKTKPSSMTPEQQARFNAYMKENSNVGIQTPEWLNLSSGATRFAQRFNNMGTEELSMMPGDISEKVDSAFKRGLDYSVDADFGGMGRFSTDGNYNPFGTNNLQSLYSGLSYQNNSPNLGVRLSPKEQEVTLRGKGKQLKLKRNVTDKDAIGELAFSLSPIGQALNVYGKGTLEGLGDFPNLNRANPYSLEHIKPEYNVQAGIRGQLGPVNYNVRGNYNPDTGYRYNADAELSLLRDRLNIRGDVSGTKEAGLQSLSAEARARLAKGLSVKAEYNKSKNQPDSYNIGFSYNKAFQGGGMSIPGVNGTVVSAAPTTLKEAYKKKKK
jgi:hypothetical protein